jgi:hypothetical protein
MKWIKHQTSTWNDERIADLVGAGGQAGLALYGAYWRVQEILAAQMDGPDPSCSIQYSVSRWSVLMSLRPSHVSHYLRQLAEKGLVTVEWNGSDIRVKNRKLLKYRDEYSRKSGHTQENVPPRTELEEQSSKERKAAQSAPLPPRVPLSYDPDADPEENIPDGLAPTQYAHFVLDSAAIPASNGLRMKTADAIGMLARLEECSVPEATRRMLARIREAQRDGPFKANFWLEEGNWKAAEAFSLGLEDE